MENGKSLGSTTEVRQSNQIKLKMINYRKMQFCKSLSSSVTYGQRCTEYKTLIFLSASRGIVVQVTWKKVFVFGSSIIKLIIQVKSRIT